MEEVYKPKNSQDFTNYISKESDNNYLVYLTGDIEEDLLKYKEFIKILQEEKNEITIIIKTLGAK